MHFEKSANITVHGDTNNTGAYMTCGTDKCSFKTRNYFHEDIHEHTHGSQAGFAFSHNPQGNDIAGINTVSDAGLRRHKAERVTRATVSSNFHIEAQNDISGLNRDINRMQQVLHDTKTTYRAVIPIVDVQKLSDLYKRLRNTKDPVEREHIQQEMGDIVNEHASEESEADDDEPDQHSKEEHAYTSENDQSQAQPESTDTNQEFYAQESTVPDDSEPILVAEVNVTREGEQQKEAYLSLTPEQLDTLVNHLDGMSYLNLADSHFDDSTQRYVYRFTSDSKTYTDQLRQLLISVFGKTKYRVVDFSKWLVFGFGEGLSGIDVQESYIGKSKAQEWGRKIGCSAGAALGITKFIQQAFLYASSVAKNTDGPTLTSGGAAVVTLATAWPLATAGACVGAACYLAYKATKDPHDTDAYHVDNENSASGDDQTQPNQPVTPTSENKGIIKRLDEVKLFKRHEKHLFSDNHIRDGIDSLGTNREHIVNQMLKRIREADYKGFLQEGDNRIATFMNGHQAEIHVRVIEGEAISYNLFKGLSARKGRIIYLP